MRPIVLASLAGAALVTIAALALVAWKDSDKSAQAGGSVTVGFDMNTAGNTCPGNGTTDCTLGTIDTCVQVPSGGGVVTIDVFLDGLPQVAGQPAKGGITSFQYHIGEKNDLPVGTVSAITHATKSVNLLVQGAAVNLQDYSDPAGLTTIPSWDAVVGDLGDVEYNPPFTKGVLSRLEIDTTGRPDGVYGLTIDPPGTQFGLFVGDVNGDDYCSPDSPNYVGCDILDANSSPQPYGVIAVGVPCGSPLPTATPSATPTATPGGPTPTPGPTLTPGPSPTATSTGTPTPQPDLVAGWNHACYLGAALPISEALADLMPGVLAVYRLLPDQGYDKWFANNPDISTIDTVSPYEALFILMANDADWPQEPAGAPPTGLDLVQHWNSACYSGQTKDVPSATASIAGKYTILYLLTPGQGWKRFDPARPEISNLTELPRFAAVLVLVSQPGVTHWAFTP